MSFRMGGKKNFLQLKTPGPENTRSVNHPCVSVERQENECDLAGLKFGVFN